MAEGLCSLPTMPLKTHFSLLLEKLLGLFLASPPAGSPGSHMRTCCFIFKGQWMWALVCSNGTTLFSGRVPCVALIQDAYCWD